MDRDIEARHEGGRDRIGTARWVPRACYALVLAIALVDWMTSAGVVVGIFLSVPILLASTTDSRRHVVGVWAGSLIGFVVAALYGTGPIAPPLVWLPNRAFTTVTLLASGLLALSLQRRRMDAEAARDAAESARDLGHLMHSLMAHDLRAPLVVARQGFEMVRGSLESGVEVDRALLAEVEARMERSLRAVETVLRSARAELDRDASSGRPRPLPVVDAVREIEQELEGFRDEASRRGKELLVDAPCSLPVRTDAGVLRQGLSLLVDNAIRHADPGPVRVSARLEDGELAVRVADSGPGFTAHRAASRGSTGGSGIGLRLCHLLAHRSGGGLDLARDEPCGTEFVLRLPAEEG